MQSCTFAWAAYSAAWRSTSAARFFSSSVGGTPLKTASGEWNGPAMTSPPRAAVISTAQRSRSTAASRTAASSLIGLACGVAMVTVVAPRPWFFSSRAMAL